MILVEAELSVISSVTGNIAFYRLTILLMHSGLPGLTLASLLTVLGAFRH